MDSNLEPMNHFRSSGATAVEVRWKPGNAWVRPRLRNAIRRITDFFLRPWDGTGIFRNRWFRRTSPGPKTESERRVPKRTGTTARIRKLLTWTTGLVPAWRIRADFDSPGDPPSQLLSLQPIPEGYAIDRCGNEDPDYVDSWIEQNENNLLEERTLDERMDSDYDDSDIAMVTDPAFNVPDARYREE